jgi:hypothetical protein
LNYVSSCFSAIFILQPWISIKDLHIAEISLAYAYDYDGEWDVWGLNYIIFC